MRCSRCRHDAETKINVRHAGIIDVCLPCARVILTDRQCDGVPQPKQPPGVIEEANRKRVEYSEHARSIYGDDHPKVPRLVTV